MGGRVNTCYFLDFEKFLQKKGKKGYYGHFGTLAKLCPEWQKWPRYQNMHITLFYPFFAKCFRNLKSNHKYHQNRSNRKKGPCGQSDRNKNRTFFFSLKISITEICSKMTSFFCWVAKYDKLTNCDGFSQMYCLKRVKILFDACNCINEWTYV